MIPPSTISPQPDRPAEAAQTAPQPSLAVAEPHHLIVLWIIAWAFIDLIVPSIVFQGRSVIVAIWPGFIVGQFMLLAAWGVLGTQRFVVRWCLALAMAEIVCW